MALIDKEELLEKVKKRKELTEKEADGVPRFVEYYVRLNGVTDGIDRVRQIIEEMPTVDQPKKGKWIIDEYGIHHCPFCKAINETVYQNFCPGCGADMRKDGEQE